MDVINLLWDDGIVVLKDEPLNVMGPETLFFHRLGLDPQVCVVMEVGEGAANIKKKIIKKKSNSKQTFSGSATDGCYCANSCLTFKIRLS